MRVYVRTQKADRAYMTIEQYAEWCGISRDTVIRRINKGILKIYQPERRGRILIELENGRSHKDHGMISNFAQEFTGWG